VAAALPEPAQVLNWDLHRRQRKIAAAAASGGSSFNPAARVVQQQLNSAAPEHFNHTARRAHC
jgi:hypothetical protein